MPKEIQSELPDKLSMILKHMVLDFTGTSSLDGKPISTIKESLKTPSKIIDITILIVCIKTIVAFAFFVTCAVLMNKMFWMLEQCVPINQEAAFKARARRWKRIVATFVIGAWICAFVIVFAFNMPKALQAVVFAGPITITVPVLAWVFLVY